MAVLPPLTGLDILVESLAAAFLETLDDNERATAAWAAEGAVGALEHHGPSVFAPPIADVERAIPQPHDDEHDEEITNASAIGGRLNAPQLQAQLSPLSTELGCVA